MDEIVGSKDDGELNTSTELCGRIDENSMDGATGDDVA